MSSVPLKFSPSERERRPPVGLPKTRQLAPKGRDPVAGPAIDEDDGLIGEDNPPLWPVALAARRRPR